MDGYRWRMNRHGEWLIIRNVDIMHIDWGYCYNEQFDAGELDFPWQIEFSSTQSAAVTEENTNKQTQMNTSLLKIQVITSLKESELSEENMQ